MPPLIESRPVPMLLDKCIGEGALAEAWTKVLANRGCPGVDGVSVDTYRECALSRLASLRTDVLCGRYRPQALLGTSIVKPGGGLRRLAIPVVQDRVLQTAVAQLLARLLDPEFDDASFAYRFGRSVQQALARVKDCRDQGLRWVVDADIRDFFDCIDHSTLLSALRRRLPDDSLTVILAQWLAAPVRLDEQLQPRRRGVPQGSPISPILANLYLHPLDRALASAGHIVVRYADDFLILCRSRLEAESAQTLARTVLEALRLEFNEEKTRITHFQAGFRFLGVRFEGEKVTPIDPDAAPWLLSRPIPDTASATGGNTVPILIPAIETEGGEEESAELLDPDTVRFDDLDETTDEVLPRSVYITTQGVRLYRQAGRLVVSRGQDAIARIPLQQLDQIIVHGNVMVSTALIRHCRENHLGLAFADANGIRPALLDAAPEASMSMLKAQVRRSDDPEFGLEIARACVRGKLHNCRVLLRRFARRNSPDRVARAISILTRTLAGLPRCKDLNTLRGYEGRAARSYFAALSSLIPADWEFDGRNRLPPLDPVNALLSYGYAVLSHTLHSTLLTARLHPGFGHLHAQVEGRPALVCDLMEEFRPLAVDLVVLTLIRRRSLNPREDFELPQEGDACCRILPAAKQLLIARLEARFAAPVACVDGDGKTSLHRLLRRQAARYAAALCGTQPYQAHLAAQ